jgi:hypothetical protein
MIACLWGAVAVVGRRPADGSFAPELVRRLAVFFAAGGKQDRHNKNNDDDGDNEEWRSNAHGAGSCCLD